MGRKLVVVIILILLFAGCAGRSDDPQVNINEDIVKAERHLAADLFVQSTTTANLDTRKYLLIKSRGILLRIIEQYPDTT